MQAHHGNGRNSRRSAIGGHPSARRLFRLCTFHHEELSLETSIPVANLFAWPAFPVNKAAWEGSLAAARRGELSPLGAG